MQFIMLNWALISAFMVGTNALVSRYTGAKEPEQASRVLFNIALFAFAFSIPIMLLGFQLAEGFFHWMVDAEESLLLGISYLHIILYSLPFLFLKAIFVAALSASGDTKTPFKIKIFGSLLNFSLNYLLIYGTFGFPELGVDGAAISTVCVNIIEFSLLLYVLIRRRSRVYLLPEWSFDLVKRALKVGSPTALERFLTFSAMVLFAHFIAQYGTEALAGFQVGLRIEGIAFMPGVGFMIASMALMGQNLGAGNPQEARDSVLATASLGAILLGTLGLFMIIFPEQIAYLFTDDPGTIDNAVLYLQVIGFSQIPLAVMFVLDGGLRGAGATKTTLWVNAFSLWFLRIIPVYFIASAGYPLLWIFILMSAETFSRAGIFYYIFLQGKWRNIQV